MQNETTASASRVFIPSYASVPCASITQGSSTLPCTSTPAKRRRAKDIAMCHAKDIVVTVTRARMHVRHTSIYHATT